MGLRDRTLIGVMIYTFARVGAVLQMNVGDYFAEGRRGWCGWWEFELCRLMTSARFIFHIA
jgi:hypothetical protein